MNITTRKTVDKIYKALERWATEKDLDGEMFTLPDLISRYYPPSENIDLRGPGQVFYKLHPLEKGDVLTLNGHQYKITAIDDKANPIPYKIEAFHNST